MKKIKSQVEQRIVPRKQGELPSMYVGSHSIRQMFDEESLHEFEQEEYKSP